MDAWFNGLILLEKVFFFMALPATVILVLQTILTAFGLGGDNDVDFDGDIDTDMDFDMDGDACGADHSFDGETGIDAVDPSLKVLTLRGLVAFFAVGGWSGFALAGGAHIAVTVILSVVFGSIALIFVAYMYKWTMKLQEDGTINLLNAVDKTGEVYLPIGANNSKTGKIALEVQGRFIEMDAITRSGWDLPVGTAIKVTDMLTDTIAIVEPLAVR